MLFDKINVLSIIRHAQTKMYYLAFDIEAANGYMPSSICSIGVVVADEKFNIIRSQNIWVNPKTKYNLNGTRQNVGIDLHLDKKLLDASPDFSQVYQQVKSLLTDKDFVVLGHAVDADVRMLNSACERYNLPSIDFDFICSQLLYKLYKGEKEVKALSKIADELGVQFVQHNSEQDALMSMLTLKYLVADSGLTVDELMQKSHVRKGTNQNFQLSRPVSLDGQLSKRTYLHFAIEKIKSYGEQLPQKTTKLKGKVFCLARSIELSSDEVLLPIVEYIYTDGGRYASKLIKANYYVLPIDATQQDILRQKRVAELASENLIKSVTIDELYRL